MPAMRYGWVRSAVDGRLDMAGGTGPSRARLPVAARVPVPFPGRFAFGKTRARAELRYGGDVSIAVPIPELFVQVERWGWCYLLTVSDDGRPHLLALRPMVAGDGAERRLRFATGGGSACRNARARSSVTLVFPPGEHSDGFSLVVDGNATIDDPIVDAPVYVSIASGSWAMSRSEQSQRVPSVRGSGMRSTLTAPDGGARPRWDGPRRTGRRPSRR